MSAHCSHSCDAETSSAAHTDPRYRRVLWIALVVNALMFGIEIFGGVASGSVSLLADAVDFAGDAANYGLSLVVLSMSLTWRARAALLKGLSMGAFGVLVLGKTVWATTHGVPPEPVTMGVIALLALAANVGVAVMLFAWRAGDANMRSVWLCSRNDAIGNVAVALAAVGVFGTGAAWPDLLVALIMASLALHGAVSVVRHARAELRGEAPPSDPVAHHH